MTGEGGSWPADPADPQCPECGGPVSATASYCMHCEADLPPARSAAPDADGSAGDDAAGDYGATAGAAAGGSAAAATDAGDPAGWLRPDGLLDDATTVVVGVVGGLLAGVLVGAAFVFALPGGWPLLAGGVGWAAATGYAVRSRTLFGATRKAAFLLAGLLVAAPVAFSASAPMAEPGIGSRLGLAAVMGVFAWPVAVALGVVGYLARSREPDSG